MGEAKRRAAQRVQERGYRAAFGMTIGSLEVDAQDVDPSQVQAGVKELQRKREAKEWAYGENAVVGTLTCPTCGLTIKAEEKRPGEVGFGYPDNSHLVCNSKAREAADERPEALSCPDLNRPYMRYINMLMASFAPERKAESRSH